MNIVACLWQPNLLWSKKVGFLVLTPIKMISVAPCALWSLTWTDDKKQREGGDIQLIFASHLISTSCKLQKRGLPWLKWSEKLIRNSCILTYEIFNYNVWWWCTECRFLDDVSIDKWKEENMPWTTNNKCHSSHSDKVLRFYLNILSNNYIELSSCLKLGEVHFWDFLFLLESTEDFWHWFSGPFPYSISPLSSAYLHKPGFQRKGGFQKHISTWHFHTPRFFLFSFLSSEVDSMNIDRNGCSPQLLEIYDPSIPLLGIRWCRGHSCHILCTIINQINLLWGCAAATQPSDDNDGLGGGIEAV